MNERIGKYQYYTNTPIDKPNPEYMREDIQTGRKESILDVNALADEFEGPFLVEEVDPFWRILCSFAHSYISLSYTLYKYVVALKVSYLFSCLTGHHFNRQKKDIQACLHMIDMTHSLQITVSPSQKLCAFILSADDQSHVTIIRSIATGRTLIIQGK